MKHDYDQLILEQSLDYNQITALLKHLNTKAKKNDARCMVMVFNENLKNQKNMVLQKPHFVRSYKFLMKTHYEKKETVFTTDHLVEVLNNLDRIEIVRLYNAGTIFQDFFTPLYKAVSIGGKSFMYFVFKSEIQIYNNKQTNHEQS